MAASTHPRTEAGPVYCTSRTTESIDSPSLRTGSSSNATANTSARVIALAAACALSLGLMLTATGCASTAQASNTALNPYTPAQQLASASNDATDRPNQYTPDVSDSCTVSRTVYLDEDGETADESASDEAVAYNVKIAIDPYSQLWEATGVISDVNYNTDTLSVRLTKYEKGHFEGQDVLLSYANYLSFSERKLIKGSIVTFQYLLTNPMRTPLQAYNLKLVS